MPHVSTRSVAHEIAAGRIAGFAEWAAAPELRVEDTPQQQVTAQPQYQLLATPMDVSQQTLPQPLIWGSADRMLGALETMPQAPASVVFADGVSSPAWDCAQLLPTESRRECHLPLVEPAAQEEGGSGCGLTPAVAARQPTPSEACLHVPGNRQPRADHLEGHTPGSSAGRLGSDWASSLPTCPPSQHTPGIDGIVGTPYDSLRAARQVFGRGMDVHSYSPALTLRGWDGSARMAFTAWQHLTVVLWQARLHMAAPLLRRRRFR
jgi:hypothetical protein